MLEDMLHMLPAIDQIANGEHLLLLKASIPYLPQTGRPFAALCIKAAEIANILSFYHSSPKLCACSADIPSAEPDEILQTIRCFCSESEQLSIDRCIQMLQFLTLCLSMQDAADPEIL